MYVFEKVLWPFSSLTFSPFPINLSFFFSTSISLFIYGVSVVDVDAEPLPTVDYRHKVDIKKASS